MFWLGWITDILRSVGTMYATFHFTESRLILHVLPYASTEVSTYIYTRTPGRKPAQDIKDMVLELNEAWWDEKKRTKCRWHASEHVLDQGQKNLAPPEAVKPVKKKHAVMLKKHLTHLKISAHNLTLSELQREIKSAYRRQAMEHHPDRGGDEEMFKKISEAYYELDKWLESPSYRTRRGVPGKWSYDGLRKKWVTPL
ncbi:MAG: DnaJ domain-containing protein [Syntrophobacteria bacterium]